MIDAYVTVRPEVIRAIHRWCVVVRHRRCDACGSCRWRPAGRAALPDLIAALKIKGHGVIYESLIAIQKIRDASAVPR